MMNNPFSGEYVRVNMKRVSDHGQFSVNKATGVISISNDYSPK